MAAAYLALSLFVGPRCHSITAFFAAAAVMLSMCPVAAPPLSLRRQFHISGLFRKEGSFLSLPVVKETKSAPAQKNFH